MLRPATAAALLALLTACADDPPLELTPLAELCGAAGPLHLLPLAPDERLGARGESFTTIGDRLFFIAGQGERFVSPVYGPLPRTTTVYAVGPCGEDPIVVARDLETIFVDPHWPDVLLGCSAEDRHLVRLDPTGATDPTVLARGACGANITDHGLLVYTLTEDNRVSADLYPLLDPKQPVFGPPVQVAAPVPIVNSTNGSFRLLPDEILLVEADGDLVSVALPDLTTTVLQSGVLNLAASDDGRYVLFQLGPGSGDDPYNPIGDINILDRTNNTSIPVGTGTLSSCYPCFPAPGLARIDLNDPAPRQRLITLPDLQFLDAPEGHELIVQLPDGRWLSTSNDHGPWYLTDLAAGTTTLVTASNGRRNGQGDDHLDLLRTLSQKEQTTAPLVRYFFDGREPQTLAEHANLGAFVRPDDSVVTMRFVDDTWLGELTLVDPDTREATRIDDRVIAGTPLATWKHPDDPDILLYGVVDGERSGVWLARPASSD